MGGRLREVRLYCYFMTLCIEITPVARVSLPKGIRGCFIGVCLKYLALINYGIMLTKVASTDQMPN